MSTTEQVENKGNNPEGKGGFGDNPENINAGGRPKNSMKSYVANKLAAMSDEEKEQWLQDKKISGDTEWKMAEGNPKQDTELGGEVTVHQPIYGGLSRHDSNTEDIQPEEED